MGLVEWLGRLATALVVFHAFIAAPAWGAMVGVVLVHLFTPLVVFPLVLLFGLPVMLAHELSGMLPAQLPFGGVYEAVTTLPGLLLRGHTAALLAAWLAAVCATGLWTVYRAAWRALLQPGGGVVHHHLQGRSAAASVCATAVLSLGVPLVLWLAPALVARDPQAAFVLAYLTPTPEMGALVALLWLARWTGADSARRWVGVTLTCAVAIVSIDCGRQFRPAAREFRHDDGGFAAALAQRQATLARAGEPVTTSAPVSVPLQTMPERRFHIAPPTAGGADPLLWTRPARPASR